MLREQVAALHDRFHLRALLPEPPCLYFSGADVLPAHATRRALKTAPPRMIHTLTLGSFWASEQILKGNNGGLPLHSATLRGLVPPHCRYGYDLIVFCGLELYLHGRQVEEIKATIRHTSGVKISASGIQVLGYKFLKYLGRLHRHSVPAIRLQMADAGGYILHVDATCEEKDPLLLSCIDGLSGQVLYSKKIHSENQSELGAVLETVKGLFGIPLAVVTDMGRAFPQVVARVFPDVRHVICHFHFLRDLGKDLLQEEYDGLRRALSHKRIRASMCALAKNLEHKLGGVEKITAVLNQPDCQSYFAQIQERELLRWYALQMIYETQAIAQHSEGYGFPFDRPYVDYFTKLRIMATHLDELLQAASHLPRRDKKELLKLEATLKTIANDRRIVSTITALRERMNLFDRLRQIMRLAQPGGSQGLNDNGSLIGYRKLKTIETELRSYTTRLAKRAGRTDFRQRNPKLAIAIKSMVQQTRHYWNMLFMIPIIVQRGDQEYEIVAQRTNNLMERSFRKLKRRCRRRHGRKKLHQDLDKLPSEIALVENLCNAQYVTMVMGSLDNLPVKFAELDREHALTLKAMKVTDHSVFSRMILKQLRKNDIKTLVEHRLQNGKV